MDFVAKEDQAGRKEKFNQMKSPRITFTIFILKECFRKIFW